MEAEAWEMLQAASLPMVASKLGLSPKALLKKLEQAGMLGNKPLDPTPAQIRSGRRDARKRWTPVMTESRRIGRRSSHTRF